MIQTRIQLAPLSEIVFQTGELEIICKSSCFFVCFQISTDFLRQKYCNQCPQNSFYSMSCAKDNTF